MLLHSAASIHGHEYSPNTPAVRRPPLVLSAFSATSSRSSASYDSVPSTSLRPIRRLSAGPRRNNERVSFQERELDTMIDDGLSCASECSETTVGSSKRKRKSIRSSTVYHLAHPAPTLTRQQKLLQIRPKLLLQLQRLSLDKRPTPALDVMPSMVVVPRLMKKFPRMFKGKGELGTNDVLIVKSEDYNAADGNSDEDAHEDDSVGNREVLAVICQTRGSSSNTEICFSDGSIWHATSHGKSSYEFETTDKISGVTTKARWVQRVSPRRQTSSNQPRTDDPMADKPKFHFSILDPNSRRHPILASLTQDRLDIPDTYTTCSSSAGRHPPTSPIRAPSMEYPLHVEEVNPVQRSTHTLDGETKILIQITSIWIALNKGWSPYFNYNDPLPGCPSKANSNSGHRGRSVSMDRSKPPMVDIRATTPESGHSFGSKGGKIFKSGTSIFGRSPSGILPASSDVTPPVPKRSVSSGTAFMQRAAARRAGHPPSAVVSDSEGETVPSPPARAVTTDMTDARGVQSKRMSTPSPLALLGMANPSPETPTKPHRRVQSAIYSNGATAFRAGVIGANGQSNGGPPHIHTNSANVDVSTLSSPRMGYVEKRPGKWRALLGFLRRGNKTAED